MEPDRGGYATAYTNAFLPNRTYGGVDYLVAHLGGTWDALLGEGRRIWTVADSDFHFRTASGLYSSGYAPGEYAKTHVWKDGKDMASVVAGLKSGRMFGVFGDLIDALDFQAKGAGGASPSAFAARTATTTNTRSKAATPPTSNPPSTTWT
ncbi:hypothetical protein G6F22_019907 [Rhizopus arrhizus]|nr:hypothetical protein G6F22_019907 [Rhizopus arrhizus]